MRILFLGSGEFGLPTLSALRDRHEVLAVVSQPDRPAGRHRRLTPTPIAQWALEQGLSVIREEGVNRPEIVARLASLRPEASVVIAFGQKLGEPLIAALGRLTVNLHASLLPRWRGAAPIQHAMLAGDVRTGVSVIGLAQRMDAGPIYATAQTSIGELETAGELHDRLAALGPGVVLEVLEQLAADGLAPVSQDESLATRAPKLAKADGRIALDLDPDAFRRRVHAMTPWPGVRLRWRPADPSPPDAWPIDPASGWNELTLHRVASEPGIAAFRQSEHGLAPAPPGSVIDGQRVIVRDGAVRLLEVQPPGGRVMSIDDYARGHRFGPGCVVAPLDR